MHDRRWTEFIERHPSSSIFHTRSWLEALRRTYGFEPAAVTTSPPQKNLTNAIVLCRVRSWMTGRRLVSLPFSDHCAPLVDSLEELQFILEHLRRVRQDEHWKYVELRPPADVFGDVPAPALFDRGQSFWFHRLDLRPPLAEIHAGFHKDCIQRKIRRAERDGLLYEEGRSERLLRSFYVLQLQTRRRQKLPPQPFAWFKNLATSLGETMKIRLASIGITPVAAILTLRHKNQMVYKYGCSNDSYSQHGGTQLVFWRAIQEAKSADCVSLDMGRSDFHNPGLTTFKDRWGAAKAVMTYLRCPPISSSRYTVPNIPFAGLILFRLPDTLLTLVGSLLYRHLA